MILNQSLLTIRFCVLLLVANAFCMPRLHAENASIEYEISFEERAQHFVHVEARFPNCKTGENEFFLPVWTPGSYLIREYAQHIDSISCADAQNNRIPVSKFAKNRWKVRLDNPQDITLRYRVYCNEMTVRTNFVDASFALINGAATFLTREPSVDKSSREIQIQLNLPEDWKRCFSSMATNETHRFSATSYAEVVDSPIVAGNPTVHPFEVNGQQHYLVNIGDQEFWEGDRAAISIRKIVAEHQKMWGNVPYTNYHFLNVIGEAGGGLEHDNSTVLMTSRWTYRNPQRFRRWLSLVSHEFFHTWNVRRLRPEALVNYDFENEQYFDELWVAEGVTSYYQDLAMVRAELTSPKEFLRSLSGQIASLQNTPGRLVQSLKESSHDTWIKFYRPNENSKNTSISYYNKGAVVAFLLDIKIRELTENRKSLDDVMRTMYKRHSETGYTNQDFFLVASEISESDLAEWFEMTVESAEELDYSGALDWLGLKFKTSATPTQENQPGSLQLSTSDENGRLTVSRVVAGGPAAVAGINVDDELIAINGYRVTSDISDRIKQYKNWRDCQHSDCATRQTAGIACSHWPQ